ncbi:MAG: HEAT repeat domain-containing protein [Ignavibacteriae bacterium]|nr:MAG: HEAT repeat domain-containing protein [Ignavibacteriota bacterium]
MKNFRIVPLFVLSSMCAGLLLSQEASLKNETNKELIEENYLVGLQSENAGLQRSCALMLGQMRSSRAVVPLIHILKENTHPELKIAAAWALCTIGDSRGTFAVKQAVEFNDCCETQLACAWYYENLVQPGTFYFKVVGETALAEIEKGKNK